MLIAIWQSLPVLAFIYATFISIDRALRMIK